MWTCSGCDEQVEGRVLPFGWFAIKDPGEYLVCSTRCMDSIYAELNKVDAQAQAEWQANGTHLQEESSGTPRAAA